MRFILSFVRTYSSKYNPFELDNKWLEAISTIPSTPAAKNEFQLILPPPNVTGNLHLGHAYSAIIQDAICRFQILKGFHPNWIPGTDHAGIATESVVKKRIASLSNHCDLGKELDQFASSSKECIRKELKSFGFLLNWQQEYYTKSKEYSEFVQNAFIELIQRGLIYRQEKFVNWCSRLQTAIADIEVEHVDISSPTLIDVPGCNQVPFGSMYQLNFSKEVSVFTSRPESCFGDVAICVHPEDSRYRHLIGTMFKHPITFKIIPMIADDSIDMQLGSGVMKVTPSINQKDNEIARKHGLLTDTPIFTDSGLINYGEMPKYHNKNRFLVKKLLTDDFNLRTIPHCQSIPRCKRTGDVIETLSKMQWYFRTSQFKNELSNLEQLGIDIRPIAFRKMWKQWAENIQDWCISRQITWGHSIPVFYFSVEKEKEVIVAASSYEEALKQAQNISPLISAVTPYRQDTDVLDTWFSSSLIPLFNGGIPHSLIVSGHDILFFWIMRMTVLSLALKNTIPFKTVLLHPLIRNSAGKKMSKSDGNALNPMEIILPNNDYSANQKDNLNADTANINNNKLRENSTNRNCTQNMNALSIGSEKTAPTNHNESAFGTDALRLSLLGHSTNELFITYDSKKTKIANHFCNKLYNIYLFINQNDQSIKLEQSLPNCSSSKTAAPSHSFNAFETHLAIQFNNALSEYLTHFESLELFKALQTLQAFILDSFCRNYIEYSKAILYAKDRPLQDRLNCLEFVKWMFSKTLILLSPFAPVISKELTHQLSAPSELFISPLQPIKLPADSVKWSAFVSIFYESINTNRSYKPEQFLMHSELRTPMLQKEMQLFIQSNAAIMQYMQKKKPTASFYMSCTRHL